jgi:putative ABC transport system permease protein
MEIIQLSYIDLILTGSLIIALAYASHLLKVGNSQQILVAAIRNFIQLVMVGYVLQFIFNANSLSQVMLISSVMLLVAGWEINARQKYRLTNRAGLKIATFALFISSFIVTWFALQIIISPQPWYSPQYAIPLLGMLLGNTMNGISLGMDNLSQSIYQQRFIIEQRLMLGETSQQAISDIKSNSIRTGMIPIINSMAIAGIVSMPGMMTGQILSGTEPLIAVRYQIMIFYLISSGAGFGIMIAVWQISKRLFDDRDRLLIDKIERLK